MLVLTEEGRQGSDLVHSSMYDSVTTLIPRELMGYTDYPFDRDFPGSEDPRRFCGPEEVHPRLFSREFHCTWRYCVG